jgi:hypothetical protein
VPFFIVHAADRKTFCPTDDIDQYAAAIDSTYCYTSCSQPKTSIDDAMEEARMVMCGAIEGLLKKQGE